MTKNEITQLIQASGLNLLSDHVPRFLVSLHVGERVQTAAITFGSQQSFEHATTEQAQEAIDTLKTRLLRAAKTQQGDIAQGGEVAVETPKPKVVQAGINYPAH